MATVVSLEQLLKLRESWKQSGFVKDTVVGFTCSSFDILHAGHAIMLEDAKKHCDILVVALQSDPTLDRPVEKNKPVQSLDERRIQICAVRYVDYVIEYNTEADLYELLTKLMPDVRILGTDWQGKKYTGYEIDQEKIKIYWHQRSHPYSTSSLRRRIHEAEEGLKKIKEIKECA